jgi:hypothetical protein
MSAYLLYDHENESGIPFPRNATKRAFTSETENCHQRVSGLADATRCDQWSAERQRVLTSQCGARLVSGVVDVDHVRMLQLLASAEQVQHFGGARALVPRSGLHAGGARSAGPETRHMETLTSGSKELFLLTQNSIPICSLHHSPEEETSCPEKNSTNSCALTTTS